jgi:hypothetical protein
MSQLAGHTGGHFDDSDLTEPVLALGGRRSVVASWPPDAVCEECDRHEQTGYVGPVEGYRVLYPDAELRFVCKTHAREDAGLGERDQTGHLHKLCESDDEHVDQPMLRRGELEDMTPEERIDYVEEKYEYPQRGWTVLSVERASVPAAQRTMGLVSWDVKFCATRDL